MEQLMNLNDVNNKIMVIRNQSVILDSAVAELYGVETKRINEALKNNPEKFPEGYVWELNMDEKREVIEIFDNLEYNASMAHLNSGNPNTGSQTRAVENFDRPQYNASMAHLNSGNPNTGSQTRVVENFDHPQYNASVAHLSVETANKGIQTGVIKIFDNPEYNASVAYLEKIKLSPTLPKAFTEKGLYMLATILKSPQATQTTLAIIEAFTKMRQMSHAIVELMQDHENPQKQNDVIEKGETLLGEIIGSALETVDTESSFELNLAALKIKHSVKRSKIPKQL